MSRIQVCPQAEITANANGAVMVSALVTEGPTGIGEGNAVCWLAPAGPGETLPTLRVRSQSDPGVGLDIANVSQEAADWISAAPPFSEADAVEGEIRRIGKRYLLVIELAVQSGSREASPGWVADAASGMSVVGGYAARLMRAP